MRQQKKIGLGLVIHNHQPVGNFPFVFAQLYDQAYEPMIGLLERHPGVYLAMHYSGPLLDWLLEERPEFVQRIAALVRRGQVEIVTGAFYEPILPMIPDRDKVEQVTAFTAELGRRFASEPTGLWLAERVWEPDLPTHLARAGVEYVVLDDSHFKMAGVREESLFGYYLTEDQNNQIKVFPTLKTLRYTIPWADVEEVLEYLRSHATEDGHALAVMGDDGEKFGGWPGTYQHCYTEGWLDKFFTALENNASWLQTVHLGRWAREQKALGTVYLPTASYPEMMEWALPAAESALFSRLAHELADRNQSDILAFMRGGFWRNFLVKYPEINSMQKKMMRVHQKVWRIEDPPTRERALKELWKGQCNCPYWHGVFGGIYLTHIRAAIYQHLLRAENVAEADLERTHLVGVVEDYDRDGADEVILESSAQNLYLDLAEGGSLQEWDHRAKSFNLACTLTRRPEAYHEQLLHPAEPAADEPADTPVERQHETAGEAATTIHAGIRSKQKDVSQYLFYDWYRRACLIDHFVSSDTSLQTFAQCAYGEQGDFVNQPYAAELSQSEAGLSLRLQRQGNVWVGPQFLPLDVEKTLRLAPDAPELVVDYAITNRSAATIDVIFGSEWNFNLLAGGHNDDARVEIPGVPLRDAHADATGESTGVGAVRLSNRWLDLGVELTFTRPCTLWRFPVDTVSNSEGGVETVYQGTCLLAHWRLHLAPGQTWDLQLRGRLS